MSQHTQWQITLPTPLLWQQHGHLEQKNGISDRFDGRCISWCHHHRVAVWTSCDVAASFAFLRLHAPWMSMNANLLKKRTENDGCRIANDCCCCCHDRNSQNCGTIVALLFSLHSRIQLKQWIVVVFADQQHESAAQALQCFLSDSSCWRLSIFVAVADVVVFLLAP